MRIHKLKFNQLTQLCQQNRFSLTFQSIEDQIFQSQEKVQKHKKYYSLERTVQNKIKEVSKQNKRPTSTRKKMQSNQKLSIRARNTRMTECSQSQSRTATNRFFHSPQIKKNSKKQDIFLELKKEIANFMQKINPQQKKQTAKQFKQLLNIFSRQKQFDLTFKSIGQLQNQLSKIMKHRIVHLFYYLIFWKMISVSQRQNPNLEKELRLLIICEYHSRTFKFWRVALLLCLQIQQRYIKLNNFDESRKYAIKCLKLCVIVNDRYNQIKILQYIGVLRYYEGVLNAQGSNSLTDKQRRLILNKYNEQEQTPHLICRVLTDQSFEQQPICSFEEKEQLFFNEGFNFIDSQVPSKNIKKFTKNFHEITKEVRKNYCVKDNMRKLNQVGKVKKFIGNDNFITLHPQTNFIKKKFQSQVLLTHKKYYDMQKRRKFMQSQLPNILAILQSLTFYGSFS